MVTETVTGIGRATGENRAREAAEAAIGYLLLEDVELQNARRVCVCVEGGSNLNLAEAFEVGNIVEEVISKVCQVKSHMVVDPGMGGDLKVTLVVKELVDTVED